MIDPAAVVVEAAVNGGRSRAELAAVPCSPREIAAEAARCAAAGATIVHFHPRAADGGWSVDPVACAEAIRRSRDAAPDLLLSVTSIRPAGVSVERVLELLEALALDPITRPALVSVNLGHIVAWERADGDRAGRRTIHFPNDYDDVFRLLTACRDLGIRPELGVMDLGFVSNAVALLADGALPDRPWFLIELDSPAFGAGPQVAPSTVANYDALAAALAAHVPGARWAAHGFGLPGYAVVRRALETGAHVRVGFEDAVVLPDGSAPRSNADLVAWTVGAAREVGRRPATAAETRAIVGIDAVAPA